MIIALELELNRPLRVELFGDNRRRLEGFDHQIGLRRDGLHAAQQIGRVLFFRQHRAQVVEPRLEVVDFRFKRRQLLGRGDALGDVSTQSDELGATRFKVSLRSHLVVVVKQPAGADPEGDEGADLGIPR